MLAENDKLKRIIIAIESLIAKERPTKEVEIYQEETICIDVLTILTVVLFGLK